MTERRLKADICKCEPKRISPAADYQQLIWYRQAFFEIGNIAKYIAITDTAKMLVAPLRLLTRYHHRPYSMPDSLSIARLG